MRSGYNKRTKSKPERSVERRKAQRLPIIYVLRYKIARKKERWKKAHTEDLSGKGLKLAVNGPLKAGRNIEISFSLNKNSQPLYILCSVIWCEKIKKNRYKAGLKILKVGDITKFFNFVGEKMLELSSLQR